MKDPSNIGVNDKLMNDVNSIEFTEHKKHDRIDNHIFYEELCDRYNELSLIEFTDDNFNSELSEIDDILMTYADKTVSYNTATASSQLKHADDLLCGIETDMQALDGYNELNKLYDSSVVMLQCWDKYREYAKIYNISTPDEVQKYLDEALELSDKIGMINYFELSLEEIDLMQGRVNEIVTYLEYKYNEMVELNQSENGDLV